MVTVAVSDSVFVTVTVVSGAGAVTVFAVAPIHEQALEYLTLPEHADAYVGMLLPPLPDLPPRPESCRTIIFLLGGPPAGRALGSMVTVVTVTVSVAVAVMVLRDERVCN